MSFNPMPSQKSLFELLLICLISLPIYSLGSESELEPELIKNTQDCMLKKNIDACLFVAPRYKKLEMHKEVYMTTKVYCQLKFEHCSVVYFSALKYDEETASNFLAFLQQSCAQKKGRSCSELKSIYKDLALGPNYYD